MSTKENFLSSLNWWDGGGGGGGGVGEGVILNFLLSIPFTFLLLVHFPLSLQPFPLVSCYTVTPSALPLLFCQSRQ